MFGLSSVPLISVPLHSPPTYVAGFVNRTMSDFDGLDTDGSQKLDPKELQDFIKKRDGFATSFTIIEVSASVATRDRAPDILTALPVPYVCRCFYILTERKLVGQRYSERERVST